MKEQFFNINFEITHRCNQRCKYCYNSYQIPEQDHSKTIETINRLFEIAEIKQLTFTGGEPTISEYLIECIIHARLNNTKVLIITNASNPDSGIFKKIISAGATNFQITINSNDPAIHDNLSESRGSLARTLQNLEFIISHGGKIVPSIILTDQNQSTLERTLDLLDKYNFKSIILNRYNISFGKYTNELKMDSVSLKRAFHLVNEIAEKKKITVTSNVCTPFCVLDPNDYPNIIFGKCPDDPKLKPITVDYNGNVRLCNHSPKVAGNIYTESFKDILFSDYSLSWISTIPEFCTSCKLYEDCKGGCKSASEQVFNSHKIVDPIVQ